MIKRNTNNIKRIFELCVFEEETVVWKIIWGREMKVVSFGVTRNNYVRNDTLRNLGKIRDLLLHVSSSLTYSI